MSRARITSALAVVAGLLISQSARADLQQDVEQGFSAVISWRIDEAKAYAKTALARSPSDPAVLALMAEIKFHMSDYAGANHLFEVAQKRGAPEFLLRDWEFSRAAEQATRGYDEIIGEHFIVRFSPGKDAILAPYALETAEAALEKIGKLLGWRPESRVVIEFYPSASTLAQVSSLTRDEIANSGTIALCKWNRLMVTSPRAVVFGYEWRDTLAHELTHLLIGGASRNTVPIWLHEGIAKFAETAWRDRPGLGLSIEAQRSLQTAAKGKKLIPFEKMHPSMAKLKTQEETSLAFAEVFTFIEYMVELKGWDAIRTILKALSDGRSEEEAVLAAFGVDLMDLSARWMLSLESRKIKRDGTIESEREVVVKDDGDTPDDALHGLSKAARRHARAADLLYARGRLTAAKTELEKAYAQTKSPGLSARLARVALAVGDLESAETAARASVDASPDMPGSNVTLAEILVKKKQLEAARKPLEQAIAINPFDPRIHALLIEILADGKKAEALNQARLALAILFGEVSTRPPLLGMGGLVEIDAEPFSRVFVEKNGRTIPTGMVTPTSPFSIGTGRVDLLLVPAAGPASKRTVEVEKIPPGGEPQRIEPDKRGS